MGDSLSDSTRGGQISSEFPFQIDVGGSFAYKEEIPRCFLEPEGTSVALWHDNYASSFPEQPIT